jgi:hypothetical protein
VEASAPRSGLVKYMRMPFVTQPSCNRINLVEDAVDVSVMD